MKENKLSYDDPFDAPQAPPAPPAEESQQQTAPTPAAVGHNPAAPVAVSPNGDLSVTFKGDGGYGSPWIVPKYASVGDALVDLGMSPQEVSTLSQGNRWLKLFERTKQMNDHFAGLGGGAPAPAGNGGGGQQRQSKAPQQAQEAPNGEKQFCQHGEMEYKTGVSKKTGKPYALFSCTAPRDQQCDAKWPIK